MPLAWVFGNKNPAVSGCSSRIRSNPRGKGNKRTQAQQQTCQTSAALQSFSPSVVHINHRSRSRSESHEALCVVASPKKTAQHATIGRRRGRARGRACPLSSAAALGDNDLVRRLCAVRLLD